MQRCKKRTQKRRSAFDLATVNSSSYLSNVQPTVSFFSQNLVQNVSQKRYEFRDKSTLLFSAQNRFSLSLSFTSRVSLSLFPFWSFAKFLLSARSKCPSSSSFLSTHFENLCAENLPLNVISFFYLSLSVALSKSGEREKSAFHLREEARRWGDLKKRRSDWRSRERRRLFDFYSFFKNFSLFSLTSDHRKSN